ncbi:putative ribonuclease H-like domain-containing protein [Tanacetum coccineum]
MGLDDLYNNFKIVEQKVKRTVAVDDKNLAFLTTTSPSSTNPINTVNTGVSTGTTKVNTASTETSTASFSDATVYAFLSTQPQGSQLVHEDLEQIHDDDLEEMDLKWNMALLSMRARKIQEKSILNLLQNYEALKKQYDDLLVKLDDTAFKASTYKRGLSILEAQVVKYKESEVLFSEEIALLKRSVGHKDYLMGLVKTELEKVTDKSKRGFGYTAVPSPHPLILNRPTPLDLSYSGLEEFKQPEIVVSDDKEEVESIPKVEKKIPTATKKESVKTVEPSRRKVRYAEMYRSQRPRGNQRSWNGQKSDQLGVNFVFKRRAMLYLWSVNTVRPVSTARFVNTVRPYNTAHPKPTVSCARPKTHFQNQAQRPFYKNTALTKRSNIQNINTAKQAVNTVRPNVNTVRARGFNASNSQLNEKGFVDSGCSRHMSGNIAHLSDFKEFDGGYVTFGGGANGGRITGKGTIKTDKLDFEDVYFVKELKFNLFSVSQMCDKKNYVLFTDSECLVLSPNFKLPDESQVLLKIPRQNNMYSFDMKNIVPKDGLTCLVAKATSEESSVYKEVLSPAYPLNKIKIVFSCQFGRMLHTLKDALQTQNCLMRPIPTTEDTQVEDQEIELGNLSPSYEVSSTPHTRIHKDHPIDHKPCKRNTTFFKLQNVWVLVDLPKGHRAIGTKWVYRNKKDERGIVVRNKARLVAQGHTQEEGIDCFEDPDHPDKVYKVVKALYGLHQAPRAWYDTLATYLLSNGFQRGKIDQLIHQNPSSTPLIWKGPLVKDADADDVDEYLYRSMIGSLMYLTASRPDIMFAVCACARFQDSPLELIAYTDSDYAGATLDRNVNH